AYGLGRGGAERVAVYDFGGGTFDCTLLDLNGNVFEVLATAGDSFLGGDDVDEAIAGRMAEQVLRQYRYDARTDPQAFEKLKVAAEHIKIELSTKESASARLSDVGFGVGGKPIDLVFTMSRKEIEDLVTPLIDKSFKVTQDALGLARLTPTSFDKVILVGGTSRIPVVKRRVEAFFGTKPLDRVNPDEVVAIGAAIQAAALSDTSRKREIPAPPGLPGNSPHTMRGVGADRDEVTQTTEIDPNAMRTQTAQGRRGAVSGPPSAPPSAPPSGGRMASGPPNRSAPPVPPSAPPSRPPIPQRPPPSSPGSRPQVAAKDAPAPMTAKDPRRDDEPSIQSIPDLSVPTPFEWFPSGAPSSGGNTLTAVVAEPQTMTGAQPLPAAGMPPGKSTQVGFGAIDEPSIASLVSTSTSSPGAPGQGLPGSAGFGELRDLSIASTPSASLGAPSVSLSSPSLSSPSGRAGLPSSAEGGFGEIKDLSLVSTTGVSSPAAAVVSSDGMFGEVKDLSLVSTSGVSQSGETSVPSFPSFPSAPERTAPLPQGGAPPPPLGGTLVMDPAQQRGSSPPPNRITNQGVVARPPPTQQSRAAPPPPVPQQQPPRPPTLPQQQAQPARPQPLATTQPLQQHPSAPPQQSALLGSNPPLAHGSSPPGASPSAPGFSFGVQSSPPGAGTNPPPYGGQPYAPPPGPQPSYSDAPLDPNAIFDPRSFQSPAPGGVGAAPVQLSAAPQPQHGGAPVLVDVTPRALVVETAGGYCDTIIPRNSKIPCERTRKFSTGRDMQTVVKVRVAQGEDPAFGGNTYLGEVELSGIRPAPRGDVVVHVTFEVDADGTLQVRAKDGTTGQEARASIQLIGGVDESSVVMMINRFAQQPLPPPGGGGGYG
ncbi:MAG: Hsp70 family protein, partial [Myxococcales bacterium]|nr:Hsp70 family protein [Myxococcales bacterium]